MTNQATATVSIPLAQLRANDIFQPRYGGLEERHVRLLMESDPASWLPLLVTPNDVGGCDLIDGFHRFESATRLGLLALPCRIAPDADYPDAVLANIAHGLPLKTEDRKLAAWWLAELEPELSYREIGRRTGLHHETVKRAVEGGPPPDRQPAAPPDPLERLVRQAYRTYSAGHGRGFFGIGKAGDTAAFRRQIEAYREEDRREISVALDAFGRAWVSAAAPFLDPD